MQTLRRSTVLFTCLLIAACGSTPPLAPGRSRASLISAEQSRDAAIHAMGLVGTPYRYGGNTVDGGFDCSGLIGFVYRQSAGLATPRTVARLADFGEPVAFDALRTGDLVLFGGGRPTHAGIYVGENRFVHAPSTGGEVRLDRLDGPYWSRQRVEVRRP
ncbi:putative endopeptidase Spr precursor [Variovorax sp. PBS-H4]|uniref:C40 family peptidase n=1 Tax=Variovorax sp. PBS-H4 TaxID=434008 RepID=UPI001319A9CA|nr:C40 family peptidase [Variovorax sp. PBS-H4]VTU18264.1 putative endopeptidase Spr precursor [Variovorax sp. PBS-H4]